MKQHATLNGRWFGRYEYDGGGEPVSIDVRLTEESSILIGRMTEPNSFRPDMGPELDARLDGSRDDNTVSFVKTYVGFDQGRDPIYEGVTSNGMSRIEGRWFFPDLPGISGRFVLFRKPVAEDSAPMQAMEVIEVEG